MLPADHYLRILSVQIPLQRGYWKRKIPILLKFDMLLQYVRDGPRASFASKCPQSMDVSVTISGSNEFDQKLWILANAVCALVQANLRALYSNIPLEGNYGIFDSGSVEAWNWAARWGLPSMTFIFRSHSSIHYFTLPIVDQFANAPQCGRVRLAV